VDAALAAIGETQKKYEPLISSDEEHHIYDNYRSAWEKYLAIEGRVLDMSRQNKPADATRLTTSDGFDAFVIADKLLQDDIDLNNKGAADSTKQAASTYSSAR